MTSVSSKKGRECPSTSSSTPSFSVLMSVYKNDNPKHLALALKSIYEDQTLKPGQIVIVLDGPIPASVGDVIARFSEDKKQIVELIKIKENSGLGNALRVGSQHCKYDYIMRMDADDISDPHRFEKQIKFIKSNPDVDVVGGWITEFNQCPYDVNRVRQTPTTQRDIAKWLKTRNPMNHMTVCIKKKALEESGNYEHCPYLEDYYLWVRMIASGYKLVNLPEVLTHARIGNGFASRRGDRGQLIGRKIVQKYMLDHHMISRARSIQNMVVAYGLIYLPGWLKNGIYGRFLRKKATQ